MRALDIAATAINAGLYATFGLIFFYIFPLTTPGLGLVRFWPQVIIPAVFAALFGPWVGGTGAAIGIFISDMLIHGNPVLSLIAGVTSNFVGFALVGYVAKRNFEWKIPTSLFGGTMVLLVLISYFVLVPDYVQAWEAIIASGIIVASFVVFVVVASVSTKFRSYELGCMLGLLIGSAIIGAMVPVFSQFFIMPGNAGLTPLTVSAGLWYFVWTFATEIPFLIVLGPPILEASSKVHPAFKQEQK